MIFVTREPKNTLKGGEQQKGGVCESEQSFVAHIIFSFPFIVPLLLFSVLRLTRLSVLSTDDHANKLMQCNRGSSPSNRSDQITVHNRNTKITSNEGVD